MIQDKDRRQWKRTYNKGIRQPVWDSESQQGTVGETKRITKKKNENKSQTTSNYVTLSH